MEEGGLLERGHHDQHHLVRWIAGRPLQRRWLGLNFGLSLKGHTLRPVTVYRCPRCGLLESYAR
jgi:hypothetical protein